MPVVKSAALAVVECISVLYAVLIEKKGLWQLLALQGPAKVLSSLDFQAFKAGLQAMSEADREDLEAAIKAALPDALKPKIGGGIDLVERGIDVAEDVISFVKKGITDVKQLIVDVKALLDIK